MRAYVASGWFSLRQEASRQIVLKALTESGIPFYSPKEDGLFVPGMNPDTVFDENLEQILSCDLIVASTEGKDVGTIFECGFAYSVGTPIVYFWHGGLGKFNLMLSQSAHRVTTNFNDLLSVLKEIKSSGTVQKIPYKGSIE